MKNGTNPQPSQRADAPGSFLCYRAPHALTHYTDLINVVLEGTPAGQPLLNAAQTPKNYVRLAQELQQDARRAPART